MISFCCPTYNRLEFTKQCVDSVIQHPCISEIIISDDASTDGSYEGLERYYSDNNKVKIFRNRQNIDCYRNKKTSIELATNKWCILGDSDNKFGTEYVSKLLSIGSWVDTTSYIPSWAAPSFDYRAFEGLTITKENAAAYVNTPMFLTMLNTMNFFVNRDQFLKTWRGDIDPVTSDSEYFNYCWLERGNRIFVVPGLSYLHTIHPQSHYTENIGRSPGLHELVVEKIKLLK